MDVEHQNMFDFSPALQLALDDQGFSQGLTTQAPRESVPLDPVTLTGYRGVTSEHMQSPNIARAAQSVSPSTLDVSAASPVMAVDLLEAPEIYSATYSGVAVYEMVTRGVAVMRRRADGYLNATQILKVAGVEKGRRTKILEKEVHIGLHEKIQGGYGKYQGTWVPFERGIELAEQYGVETCLRPLLNFDMELEQHGSLSTPTKEQAMAAYKIARGGLAGAIGSPIPAPSRKRQRISCPSYQVPSQSLVSARHGVKSPPRNEEQFSERNRAVLMAIFLNEDPNQVPELLMDRSLQSENLNQPIDDQGLTALHWSATLARMQTTRLLVEKGADVCRQNCAGETPLMRSVAVVNNYGSQKFPELLDLMGPSIWMADHRGYTILHHIAVAAGVAGRTAAANYYMDCVLDWISHNVAECGTLVNMVDGAGDTALHLAAKVGDAGLVRQLLQHGANSEAINRSRLKLADLGFGPDGTRLDEGHFQQFFGVIHEEGAPNPEQQAANCGPIDHPADTKDKSSIADASFVTSSGLRDSNLSVEEFQKQQEEQLESAKQNLEEARRQYRDTSQEMARTRRHITVLHAKYQTAVDVRQRIDSLRKAILAEISYGQSLSAANAALIDDSSSGASGISTPHGTESGESDDREVSDLLRWCSALSASSSEDEIRATLRALRVRVGAFQRNDEELKAEISHLRTSAAERETQCRRLIATCCGFSQDDVDEWLDNLMHAVDVDGAEADVRAMTAVMDRIRKEEEQELEQEQEQEQEEQEGQEEQEEEEDGLSNPSHAFEVLPNTDEQ